MYLWPSNMSESSTTRLVKEPTQTSSQGWGTAVKRGIWYRCLPTFCPSRVIAAIFVIAVVISVLRGARLIGWKDAKATRKDAKSLRLYNNRRVQKISRGSASQLGNSIRQNKWNAGMDTQNMDPLREIARPFSKGSDPTGRQAYNSYKSNKLSVHGTNIMDRQGYTKVNVSRLPLRGSKITHKNATSFAQNVSRMGKRLVGLFGTSEKSTQKDYGTGIGHKKKPSALQREMSYHFGSKNTTKKPTTSSTTSGGLDMQRMRTDRINRICSLRAAKPPQQLGQKQNVASWLERAKRMTELTKSHILVDNKHKLLFCNIPNVASSPIITKLLAINGYSLATGSRPSNLTRPKSLQILRQHSVRSLSQYSNTDIAQKLETYLSFIFVRDPFERLWTSFNKRLADPRKSAYRTAYATEIKKRATEYDKHGPLFGRSMMGSADPYPDLRSQATLPVEGDVTFWQFLKYLTRTPPSMYDENWQTYNSLCDPCNVHYKFIGKTEMVKKDLAGLVKKMHTDPWVPSVKARTGIPVEVLQSGSPQLWKALGKIYREDMKLFSFKNKAFLADNLKRGIHSRPLGMADSQGIGKSKNSSLGIGQVNKPHLERDKMQAFGRPQFNVPGFGKKSTKGQSRKKIPNDNSDNTQSFSRLKRLGFGMLTNKGLQKTKVE